MQLRLECPICESRFEVEEHLSSKSICPECNREFETKPAIIPEDAKPKRENLILPEEVLKNAANSPQDRLDSNLPGPDARAEPALDENYTPATAETAAESLVKPPKRTFTHKPGKLVPVTVMLLLAVIAGGLLVYLPYALKLGEKLASDQIDSNSAEGSLDNDSSSLIENATEQGKKIPASISANGLPEFGKNVSDVGLGNPVNSDPPKKIRDPKPAPPGKRMFFSQQKIDDCWRQNQARIVRLEITDVFGSHRALGTIVDSRGWIATSFRAVAGASKIKVIQTTRSFEQFESVEPLSDLCKGVLTTDPRHDLAVLSINRRFVIEISDLKIALDDQVLGTDKLVQFCIFDDDMPMTTRETQVLGRPRFSDLDDDERKFFEQKYLNDKDINWIQHLNTEGAVPGAPLFTIDGELVGINTENPGEKMGYAIHAASLAKGIQEIPFDSTTDGGKNPLPLSTLSKEIEQVDAEPRDPKTAVDELSPLRENSVAFNLAAKECAGFNWHPKNEQHYNAIQGFARQLIELRAYAVELAVDEDAPGYQRELQDRDTLQQQIKKWQTEMINVLSSTPPRTENTMLELNELALTAIQKTNPETDDNVYQVAYVKVGLTAMDSPVRVDGTETITLEIFGSNEFLNVPFDDRFPTMLPETTWISVFVITDNGNLRFKDPRSNEIQDAKQAELRMIQGPLK